MCVTVDFYIRTLGIPFDIKFGYKDAFLYESLDWWADRLKEL